MSDGHHAGRHRTDAFVIVAEDGLVAFVNPAAALFGVDDALLESLGYSPQDIPSRRDAWEGLVRPRRIFSSGARVMRWRHDTFGITGAATVVLMAA